MAMKFCSACAAPLRNQPPTTCDSCGVRHWNDAKPCASALVVKASQLLLVRRSHEPWKDMWDVPGGFCDAGEHPIHTAEREVFEETGIRIRVVGFLGVWLDAYEDFDDKAKRTLNIYYHADVADDRELRPDVTEIADARFFDFTNLPDRIAFPDHVPQALAAWSLAVARGQTVTPLFDRVTQS